MTIKPIINYRSRDTVLPFNLEIEDDSKIEIDYYNKKIDIPNSILLLMENIRKLSHDLNIYVCRHVYREANRTTDYLAKKGLSIIDSSVWWLNFLKMLKMLKILVLMIIVVHFNHVRKISDL